MGHAIANIAALQRCPCPHLSDELVVVDFAIRTAGHVPRGDHLRAERTIRRAVWARCCLEGPAIGRSRWCICSEVQAPSAYAMWCGRHAHLVARLVLLLLLLLFINWLLLGCCCGFTTGRHDKRSIY